jgi:ribonuclease HI
MKATLHFDGSCWPNPGGLARFGWHFERDGLIVTDHGETGNDVKMSNNVAEFDACARGLLCAYFNLKQDDELLVRGDSQLVIKVMNGSWRAGRDKLYFPFFEDADAARVAVLTLCKRIVFEWIPREKNEICDELSKAHLRAAVPQDLLDEAEELLSIL